MYIQFAVTPCVPEEDQSIPLKKKIRQVARHTRPEGHFKVWAAIIFVQRPLPPTPRAETGLPLSQSIRM